ncbi:MAG: GNAT family N-acetyltransferase [Verrucomicrobiae bacterium]|nr:GNAT family N-acetyltransferase [Verrucomicrobiae bacterium]
MIRRAKALDVPRIAEIHVASWQVAYRGLVTDAFLDSLDLAKRERVWRDILTETSNPVFVAESADSVVGFCNVAPCRDEDLSEAAEITAIYLDPDHWRRGIGGRLCSRAFEFAANQGFSVISLWVLMENERARRFYESLGFRDQGGRKQEDRGDLVMNEMRYLRELPV